MKRFILFFQFLAALGAFTLIVAFLALIAYLSILYLD